MFKRLRHLRLSLAAKCQLLFGAAVVLIIAAALFVPWQRMEQLTEQLNARTAAALVHAAVLDHINRHSNSLSHPTTTSPESEPITPATTDDQLYLPSRLVGLVNGNVPDYATSFERRSFAHFLRQPDSEPFFRYYDRKHTRGYRYSAALYARDACLACHNAYAQSASTTQPTTQPARLLGIASVDIPSQIEPNQLLLNRVFILTAGLLAGTLAIAAFYLITTRLILQPVRVLQETAEKVSEGDLDIRADINTGDEFQQLSETFNVMLANLKAGEDQLRAINKSLDMKLGQLAESNVALYESNRLKSEFLANVSHELRTPLNSILGFADLLKDSLVSGTDPKITRYIQNILNSGRNLLDLINDLLDLAKIEAGRMEVRSEPLSLNDLFEGLISILKPLCETKDLTIAAIVTPDTPIVHTDPAKLQQVLYNFLSNAIKFSPAGANRTARPTRRRRKRTHLRHRPRAGHRAGQTGNHFREIPPDRRIGHAATQRHRSGPRHLQGTGATAERIHRRAQHAGPRGNLLDRAPLQNPGRLPGLAQKTCAKLIQYQRFRISAGSRTFPSKVPTVLVTNFTSTSGC